MSYEYGVVVNALNDMQNGLIEEQRPADAADDLEIKKVYVVELNR